MKNYTQFFKKIQINSNFFQEFCCILFKSPMISKLYGKEKQSDKVYHFFRYTPLPYLDTAIRKLLRMGQCVYDGGTKAMHRFTSRTPRFDSSRQGALWSSQYSRRLNRTDLSELYIGKLLNLQGQANYYSGISIISSYVPCLGYSLKGEKDC